jgi:amino acid transporter
MGGILTIAGVAVLIWNKSLAARWRTFTTHQQSKVFDRLAHFLGWDNADRPFAVFLYRFMTIFLGVFLLIMAFHSFFGTIYTGSPALEPTTLLTR